MLIQMDAYVSHYCFHWSIQRRMYYRPTPWIPRLFRGKYDYEFGGGDNGEGNVFAFYFGWLYVHLEDFGRDS